MYNFGIQQEFQGGMLFKLSYVSRLGRRLLAQADAEQLIDFPDGASGQTLSQAMAYMTGWLRANPNADPSTIPAQPWFEHVLTNVSPGETNTGFIAANFAPYPARGDVADSVEIMSLFGMLPDNVGMARSSLRTRFSPTAASPPTTACSPRCTKTPATACSLTSTTPGRTPSTMFRRRPLLCLWRVRLPLRCSPSPHLPRQLGLRRYQLRERQLPLPASRRPGPRLWRQHALLA